MSAVPAANEAPPVVCPSCAAALSFGAAEAVCSGCGRRYGKTGGVWCLTAGRESAPGFDPHYFPALAAVENVHFWFVSRRAVIVDALRSVFHDLESVPLFDVGCGTGGLAAFLEHSGLRLEGACDAHLSALRVARDRLRSPVVLVDDGRLPPLAPGRSLVGLFDVLEHIDDDEGVLRSIRDVLRPGGRLVITVPAHPFLYDEADRMACHRRRYRRRELGGKLQAAGLEVERLTHFMAILVPGLVAARAAGWLLQPWLGSARDRRDAELRVIPVFNAALRAWLALERACLRVGTFPFGTSLLAIARRPPERVT